MRARCANYRAHSLPAANKVIAEYALRGVDKPIGVATFELTRALPTELASELPSIEQVERELANREGDVKFQYHPRY